MRIFASFLILATMLAFLLALAPTATGLARRAQTATPHPVVTASTVRPSPSPATAVPTAVERSVPGSTDGLVMMSFVIALIIVLPILLQRGLWGK